MAQGALVVLSDIHAGPSNPYPDLRTPSVAGAVKIRSAFLSRTHLRDAILPLIRETAKEERFLVCAGDLSSRCHSAEIEVAADFLTHLADDLEIPESHRCLVPGNHDIDWELTKLAAHDPWYDARRQLKFESILGDRAKTFRYPSRGEPITLTSSGTTSKALTLLLLDSPFEDRHDSQPHHGSLGPRQTGRAKELLRSLAPTQAPVVVLHHHVLPMGRATDDDDFSILKDAEDLLDLLRSSQVRLVVHGHQHRHRETLIVNTGTPTQFVACGSTSVDLSRLPYEAKHTFHVVEFDAIQPNAVRGNVITRVFDLTQGWIRPSVTHHRCEASRPFGEVVGSDIINQWVDEAIAQCELGKYVKIPPFLHAKPLGRYVSANDFVESVKAKVGQRPDCESFQFLTDFQHDEFQIQRR